MLFNITNKKFDTEKISKKHFCIGLSEKNSSRSKTITPNYDFISRNKIYLDKEAGEFTTYLKKERYLFPLLIGKLIFASGLKLLYISNMKFLVV